MASCPFKSLWGAKDGEAPATAQSPPGKCPLSRNSQPQAQAPATDAAAPATCPLGFGSAAKGPSLSTLHCILCKSLYFDCSVTGCGHAFCSGCIAKFQDCPVCGADVEGTKPDPETQSLVQKFIDTHAGDMSLWEAEGAGGGAPPAPPGAASLGPDAGRASFLLQLGLRSMAGGNLTAAEGRLQQCMAELRGQAAAGPGGSGGVPTEAAAALRCQMGAVSGCLGDCRRGVGDGEAALAHYEESAEHLRQAGEGSEARQALSVTLAKVGELHHLRGDLPAALPCYEQSLGLRRELLLRARGEEAAAAPAAAVDGAVAAAALDVAVGCVKLARAREEAGGAAAAAGSAALDSEAVALLREVMPHADLLPPAQRRKLDGLAAHLLGGPDGGGAP